MALHVLHTSYREGLSKPKLRSHCRAPGSIFDSHRLDHCPSRRVCICIAPHFSLVAEPPDKRKPRSSCRFNQIVILADGPKSSSPLETRRSRKYSAALKSTMSFYAPFRDFQGPSRRSFHMLSGLVQRRRLIDAHKGKALLSCCWLIVPA